MPPEHEGAEQRRGERRHGALRQWPLHTILLALSAPLALLAHNAPQIEPADSGRGVFIAIVVAIICLGVCRLIFRDLRRAGFFASFVIVVFFSYGHFYDWGRGLNQTAFALIRHRYLLPILLVATILLIRFLRKLNSDLGPATAAVNVAAIALLIVPAAQVAVWWQSAPDERVEASAAVGHCPGSYEPQAERPDIFYIVLDAYARQDLLKETYDYDNSWFLDRLRAMGFYIAEWSQSNYTSTQLSLTSSLNYTYLAGDYEVEPPGDLFEGLSINSNRARSYLECRGYRVVAFDSGYSWSSWKGADYFLSPIDWGSGSLAVLGLNPFEAFLIQSSALRVILDLEPGLLSLLGVDLAASHRQHRERVLYSLEQLEGGVLSLPSPKFVFAHIISPHGPFLFDEYGNFVGGDGAFTFAPDPRARGIDPVFDGEAYVAQLHYLNTRVLDVVSNVLEQSQGRAVIIIQGDHGTDSGRYGRMSILNAYHLPHESETPLYNTISPVNTFRIILNTYFGEDLELVEDRSYYSAYDDLMNFEYLPNPHAP